MVVMLSVLTLNIFVEYSMHSLSIFLGLPKNILEYDFTFFSLLAEEGADLISLLLIPTCFSE